MAAAHTFFLLLSNTNTKVNKDKYNNTNTIFKNIKGAKYGSCAQQPSLAPLMFLNRVFVFLYLSLYFVFLYLSLFIFVFVFDKKRKNLCAAAIFGSFEGKLRRKLSRLNSLPVYALPYSSLSLSSSIS